MYITELIKLCTNMVSFLFCWVNYITAKSKMLTTPLALQNKCTHTCYSIIAPTLLLRLSEHLHGQVKIEMGYFCDAQHAASLASPISSLVFRSIYPRGWLKDELTSTLQSVIEIHCKVGCQPPYKVQRSKKEAWGRKKDDEVYRFIRGLIVRVEDLVHFR